MMKRSIALSVMLAAAAVASAGEPAEITLVNGDTLKAEFLFEHPNAPLAVVRSPGGGTVQSIPLEHIHQIDIGDEVKRYNPRRAFTEQERTTWQRNGHWADDASNMRIGRYAEETWDPAPLIVWAHPGRTGNLMAASSWLDETGEPLSEPPFEVGAAGEYGYGKIKGGKHATFGGDVLLPSADEIYVVVQPGKPLTLIRHLTIEENACFKVRNYTQGNLWMKDGSQYRSGGMPSHTHLGSGKSNKHTIARFCNWHDYPKPDYDRPRWPYAPHVAHWTWIDTGDKGSLEVIGYSGGPIDRVRIERGTVIVSTDSYLGNGNRASFYTQAGTTLVLLDGARIGPEAGVMMGSRGKITASLGIEGRLMFGTPEHPLTRDLPVEVAVYPPDSVDGDGKCGPRAHGASIVLGKTGRMETHSADPTKARVVFRRMPKWAPVDQYASKPYGKGLFELCNRGRNYRGNKCYYPPDPELWEVPGMPDGIAIIFRGETDFDGVVFDDVYKGGIFVDPAQRAEWKNVYFGESNHGRPDELFAEE